MSNSSASIRSSGTTGHVLASLEEVAKTQGQAAVSRNASWWDDALTLGHLETRLRACELLHSPSEYREYLREYARRLGQAGFGNKLEELIKSLHGPIYQ
jgi:protein HIRA/HIR1